MGNELTIAGLESSTQLDALREMFGGVDNTDLTEGVSASFPVLSFKGKVWRVKIKGEERKILSEDGDPVTSLHAVIVKSSPHISKIFYKQQYQEGDDASPDCFSVDGIKPDPSVSEPQSPQCATCPKNAWGSRVADNGQKLKACSDSRRIAVVPYPDIENDGNGPMLLRVPPASLGSLVAFAEQLSKAQVPYSAIVVKIGFEHELAYPKLVFKPVRVLKEDEAKTVRDMQESDSVDRMFAEAHPSESGDAPTEEPPKEEKAEAPKEEKAEAPKEEKAEAPKEEKAKRTAKAQAMDEGQTAGEDETSELDDLLKGVLS